MGPVSGNFEKYGHLREYIKILNRILCYITLLIFYFTYKNSNSTAQMLIVAVFNNKGREIVKLLYIQVWNFYTANKTMLHT